MMDRLDTMRLFMRIVERKSFTQAAEDMNLPRSTTTDAIKALEKRLGVRLLHRTTRQVSPTPEGEIYYRRCHHIVAEIEDAETGFGNIKPRGTLRVDVHGTLARHFIMPALPAFFSAYPDIELHMSEGDRLVDPVRAGALVEVLSAFPPPPSPVSLLYPRNQQMSPRLRVFIDWLAELFNPVRRVLFHHQNS